jgi:hypothetical protein
MRKTTVFVVGFLMGVVAGGLLTIVGIVPTVGAFLATPLKWFTENLHPFPSESLANLVIAWPLWFIYWGFLGAMVGLLLRAVVCLCLKWKSKDR